MGQVLRKLFQNVSKVDPFLWKPEHLNINPYPAGSKEAELWGFAFLLIVDKYNLELLIPPPPVSSSPNDFWPHLWAQSARLVGFEPYNTWPPEWALEDGGAQYKQYVPQWSQQTHKLLQQSNPKAAGDWGQSGQFGQPTADAILWQREYNHARRNEAAFYVDPYGPGCWLRREGKPYEALVGLNGPAWNSTLKQWQLPSMNFSMFGVNGQKWADEQDRWTTYKGYTHPGPDIDPSAYGPPSGRKPFPTSVADMIAVVAGGVGLPAVPTVETLTTEGTLLSALYAFHGGQWVYNAITGQIARLG